MEAMVDYQQRRRHFKTKMMVKLKFEFDFFYFLFFRPFHFFNQIEPKYLS